MMSYHEWQIGEGKTNLYEIYVEGPSIDPIAKKAIQAVKGVVPNPESFLVVKFQGTKKDVTKVKKALEKAKFKVVECEIEQ